MKKILSLLLGLIFSITAATAADKLSIEKQLIGIVGAISGTVKTETRNLKTGDKIYLNETILAGANSGTQILLLDQSTFTIGSDSEVVMDTFIYDPDTNDGKIVANVKQGSLKVISGLISKKNPDSLTVKVPEGTLGSRGTEFQTMVSKKKTSTLLIGPGKNNTLGLRPGAVLVGNKLGSTLLKKPYSISTMEKGKAPGQAKKITKNQLKKFNKKMKALKVAKLEGASKDEKKKIKQQIKQELKSAGLDKEEIKVLIKDNIQKDKEKKIKKEIEIQEKKTVNKKDKKDKKITKQDKKNDPIVRKKVIKKKDGTVIRQVTVIDPKTKKFKRLQQITDKDGNVSYKQAKGKVKKVKPKKVAKKKKVAANKSNKNKKKKATSKKDNKKKATSKKDNKKKATNKKNNNKKKATNKKNNNKKKAVKKKPPPKKKKANNKNNKKKKPPPKVKKKPPPKKKVKPQVKKKPKPKVKKKPPPKKKKVNKKKKITKKKVKKNKKKAKKKRNKK